MNALDWRRIVRGGVPGRLPSLRDAKKSAAAAAFFDDEADSSSATRAPPCVVSPLMMPEDPDVDVVALEEHSNGGSVFRSRVFF